MTKASIKILLLSTVQDEGTSTVSRSFKSLSKQERYIWQSLHSYWVKSGLNLISKSYGDNFSFRKQAASVGTDKPATKTLYITFDKSKKNSGLTYHADEIGISLYYFDDATGQDGTNTKLYSLDRLVAHELTHAVMKANIDYYDYYKQVLPPKTRLTISFQARQSKQATATTP